MIKKNTYLCVVVFFFLSGCAALIYEIVWLQFLRLVIGASAISLGILLATYMGGLLLGSLVFARLVPIKWHPVKVYALLELGVGILGILIPFILPTVREVYTEYVGYGMVNVLLRGFICALILLLPTALMGATLPAIARWFEASPQGVSRLGLLYGFNIAGAVTGAAIAGFYLLPQLNIMIANSVAVVLNAVIFVVALGMSGKMPYTPAKPETEDILDKVFHSRPIYWVTAISGCSSLGAQVIWTRIISNMYGVTAYTFTIIISVFLTGLAVGSAIAAYLIRRTNRPRLLLLICHLLMIPGIAYAAYVISVFIPRYAVVVSQNIGEVHLSNILNCTLAIFPSTLLWGASFPLCIAAVGFKDKDPALISGNVYAANTAGAILGSLVFSLMMIPLWGTQMSQWLIVGILAVSVIILLRIFLKETGTGKVFKGRFAVGVALILIVVSASLWFIRPISENLMAFGLRKVAQDKRDFIYLKEGMNATIAVQVLADRHALHVSGRIVASTILEDLIILRMLGHVPAIVHGEPRSVLIVGMGTGTTAGAFVQYPSVERIVICEIEPAVKTAAENFFGEFNHDVLKNPKVEVIFDDARHFLATTKEKFDVITSDPIHPWVRGAAALYSDEYYKLVKQRLNPGGVVTQWVPLYETDKNSVQLQMNTFFHNFSESSVWMSNMKLMVYDTVLVGRMDPTGISINKTQALIDNNPGLKQSLGEVGLGSAPDFFSTYLCSGNDLDPWLRETPLNRDINMRLEYVAGLSLNYDTKRNTLKEFLAYCTDPTFLQPSESPTVQAIKGRIKANQQRLK